MPALLPFDLLASVPLDTENLNSLTIYFLRFYVFVMAGIVGYQIITKVPALLHTPLMSATNAISGISLVGSLVAAGAQFSTYSTILGFIAVTAATINVVGGFMITDRMLKMFKPRERS
jgi:H+-translocating NAD(P) transhydrogenase subunit alpha